MSRRRLFGLLGGAAAAGVGGALLAAEPAEAASPVNIDSFNFGSSNTVLDSSVVGGVAFIVQGTDTNGSGISGAGNGTGIGVTASAASGKAVSAFSTSGIGVSGTSAGSGSSSFGVFGQTPSTVCAAVQGTSTSPGGGGGVRGDAPNGAGIVGSGSVGALFIGTSTQVQLFPITGTGPPSGSALEGSLYVDSPTPTTADLFFCTTAGTPGKWVTVASAGSSPFVPIPPARVYDSRPAQSPTTPPKTPITNAMTVAIDVTGTQATPPGGPSGVPSGVRAVLGNITIVNPAAGVFLTVYAAGTTKPSTSNINALAGGVVGNMFTSKVGSGLNANMIAITCGGGPTDFIIDIVGYYP